MMTSTNNPSPLVETRIVSGIVSEVPVSSVGVGPFISPIFPIGGFIKGLERCPFLNWEVGLFGHKLIMKYKNNN